MKNNIITGIEIAIEITKTLFNKVSLNTRRWWTSLTGDQRSAIFGIGVAISIIIALVIFFSALSWFMDRPIYIDNKHAYEDYLDKAPEMPRFRDSYRIVKYSDNDFVIQHLSGKTWTEGSFDKWWSLSSARSSMWSKIENEAEDWIHANAPGIAEVIE